MESERFDQFARRLGGQTSRRSALAALAALSLGGLAGRSSDAAASRGHKPKECDKTTPCPECQKCNKKHKCKAVKDGSACTDGGTCQSGACVCPTGSFPCDSTHSCCANGTACTNDPTCGACPNIPDVCKGTAQCGQYGPDPLLDVCGCLTSVENRNVCSSAFGKCVSCTTDAECKTALGGADAVCADLSNCGGFCDGSAGQPDTNGKACLFVGCEDFSGSAMATRAGTRHKRAIDLHALLVGR